MGSYQELVDLFQEMGIDTAERLEAALDTDSETFEVGWTQSEPATLCGKVAKALRNIDPGASSGDQGFGIQQYSLCNEPHVPEEDIKKGLFLSRRSTILTAHYYSQHHHHDDYYGDHPIQKHEMTVRIDRDFVRNLFIYRESIGRGELRLLPAELKSSSSSFDDTHGLRSGTDEKRSLLSEINRTNVLKIDPSPGTLTKVLKRFARKEQIVHLPSLLVPWIADLEISDILKVKKDEKPYLDKFQAAYHEALAEHIKNDESLDFGILSKEIQADIIQPALDELERRYRKVVASHRRLAAAGAALAFLPMAISIVSAEYLQTPVMEPLCLVPAAVTGSVASLALNRIHVENRKGDLEETDFYVLWRLVKDR